ncbi:NERD domain-containing protein [Patescibacteria group bacterium]|nr:NERD domain-containing protein [Patescibacteria group bacterium]
MQLSNLDSLGRRIISVIVLFWFLGLFAGLSLAFYGSYLQGVIVLASFALLYPIKLWIDEIGNRIEGVKGEYKVSTILKEMWPDGVRYVDTDSLDTSRGNIDHIVVAKTGVWAIETKHISGSITLRNGVLLKNGKPFPRNFLKQAYAEAASVRSLLKKRKLVDVPVYSILVFSGPYAKVRFGTEPIEGVYVVGTLGLRRLIVSSNFSNKLSTAKISEIVSSFEN